MGVMLVFAGLVLGVRGVSWLWFDGCGGGWVVFFLVAGWWLWVWLVAFVGGWLGLWLVVGGCFLSLWWLLCVVGVGCGCGV